VADSEWVGIVAEACRGLVRRGVGERGQGIRGKVWAARHPVAKVIMSAVRCSCSCAYLRRRFRGS